MEHKRKRRYTRPANWEILEFKRFLGPEISNQYTRAQIEQLYREMREMEKLLLDIYDERQRFQSTEGSE